MSEVKSADVPSPHKQEVYLSAEHRALLVTCCFYQTAQKTVAELLLKNFSTPTRVPKVVNWIYFGNKILVKLRLLTDEFNNF